MKANRTKTLVALFAIPISMTVPNVLALQLNNLYTIDLVTGQTTFVDGVGPTPGNSTNRGLAFAVPEPGSAALLVGFGLPGTRRRARYR